MYKYIYLRVRSKDTVGGECDDTRVLISNQLFDDFEKAKEALVIATDSTGYLAKEIMSMNIDNPTSNNYWRLSEANGSYIIKRYHIFEEPGVM